MSTWRRSAVAALTRRYPLYSGGASMVNRPWFIKLAGPGDDLGWVRVPGGYEILTPADDLIGRSIFFLGDFEPKITWVCSRIVRPGDTVVDIGANIGIISLLLAALVGRNGRVYSFEPLPQMVSLLSRSIERNGIENLHLQAVALGSVDGELEISVPRRNYGAASFVTAREWDDSFRITVPVRTLSHALTGKPLDHVRLVKIDVEGFEPEVFEGAAELFETKPPDAIVFELNDLEGPIREHPSIRILSGYGYRFLAIPKRLLRMGTVPVDLSAERAPRASDFVAVQPAVYGEIAALLRARR